MSVQQVIAALASLLFASVAVLLVLGVISKARPQEDYSNLDDLDAILDDPERR